MSVTASFFLVLALALCCLSITTTPATLVMIGQNYEQEYNDYISAMGSAPAGASFYTTFKTPNAFQGDGLPFVSYVNSTFEGAYAELGLSLKESYTQSQCNIVYNYLGQIASGAYDAQIDELSATLKQYSHLKWLIRVGYEVSEYIFAFKYATGCENGYQPSDIDTSHYIDAYNHIVSRMKSNGVSNAAYVYHPVRGTTDVEGLYPGGSNVDHIGFSIFDNDVCLPAGGTQNCQGQSIDPSLKASIEWAQGSGKPLLICESAAQNPQTNSASGFELYLERVFDIVQQYRFWGWVYINENWCAHGWGCPPWGDSRVQSKPQVLAYWKNITQLMNSNHP